MSRSSVALAALVVLVFSLILSGCGGLFPGGGGDVTGGTGSGSGGGTGALVVTPVAATVAPPDGSGMTFANHKVRTSGGMVALDAAGAATVPIFNGGPQYAELLDRAGNTVMMGFLSADDPALSAKSTARALLYLALAGPRLKAEGRIKLLAEAETLPGFAALESVIANQIRTKGALDLDESAFRTALEASVNASIGRGRGVIAEPTTASGLSLDTTVQGKLTVENVRLRRVLLWLRRTGYVDADGKSVDDNAAPFVKVEMPTVARYGGITGTLDSYLKGEVAYSPVNSQFDLPRYPADARQTNYTLFAVGPGGPRGEAYSRLPLELQDEQAILSYKSLFLDVFLVFVANIALPLKGDEVDKYLEFAAANGVITDIIGNLKSTAPDVGEKLGQGEYYQAFKALVTSIYTSNTILPALSQVTIDYLYANTGINSADYDMLFNGMKSLLDKMGKIDIGFTAADLSLLAFDIVRSNQAEEFLIKVVPGRVTLDVASQPVHPLAKTKISATIQDQDPQGTYEYRWSVTPNGNYWLDDSSLNGTDDVPDGILITRDAEVEINSLVLTSGTARVKCEVVRVDGGRQVVGDGETTVAFDTKAPPILTFTAALQAKGKTMQIDYLPPFGVPDNYSYQYITFVTAGPVKNAYYYDLREIRNGKDTGVASWFATRQNPYLGKFVAGLLPTPQAGQFIVGISTGSQVGGWSTEARAQQELDKVLGGILGFAGVRYELRVTLRTP